MPHSDPSPNANGLATTVLRLLPPPSFFAAPLRLVPGPLFQRVSREVINAVLKPALQQGRLDDFAGRRIAVEVTDLDLRWVVAVGDRAVEVLPRDAEAESTVRGSATDLLLLASRLEDADTLFFHRQLQLTGDVELGLALRNMLDQLPWESLPLAARIATNRGAKLARAARAAYRGEAS